MMTITESPNSYLIDTRVGRVAVRVQGEGPLLFFLHGIGSSARSFRLQLPAFSDDYTCVVWDAPGYGSSELPPDTDMDTYADAAADVIQTLSDDERAHVCGVSWGSMIATRLALNTPEAIETLTLVGSSRGHGPGTGREQQMQSRLDVVLTDGLVTLWEQRLDKLFGDRPVPEAVQQEARSIATWDIREDGYVYALRSLLAIDHLEDMHRIAHPTLVVVGAADDVAAPEESIALNERLPQSELLIVDAVGHLVNQEAPERFNTALREHMERYSQ